MINKEFCTNLVLNRFNYNCFTKLTYVVLEQNRDEDDICHLSIMQIAELVSCTEDEVLDALETLQHADFVHKVEAQCGYKVLTDEDVMDWWASKEIERELDEHMERSYNNY